MSAQSRRSLLEKAFEGVSIKGLAEGLKTTPGVIYNIKYGLRLVSARRAIEIEKITDKMGHKINRTMLRPDYFGS